MAGSTLRKIQVDDNLEDRISQLPGDILSDILSHLTVKEAGASCVLSSRWRDLWKLTSNLNFYEPKLLSKIEGSNFKTNLNMVRPARSSFVTWVNNILKVHERSTIDEFSIKFDLDASASGDIDEWIKFMIRKSVKGIVIDFTRISSKRHYCLSQECYQVFKSISNLPNIMGLRSLFLSRVNVDGDLLEYLLSKCPHLEKLSIHYSEHLISLKVAGPSIPLKYLNILRCNALESIKLCAPKLESFSYYGGKVKFDIGSNPCLTNLSIEAGVQEKVAYAFAQFSSHFSQLESLTMRMYLEDDMDVPQVCELAKLKHLVLKIWVDIDRSLNLFNRFILAAPSLVTFSFQLQMYATCEFWTREPLIEHHQCLKEVEFLGYCGGSGDFEFARFLVKTATNLEKMVIDPYHPEMFKRQPELQRQAQKLREHAQELKKSLPPRAKLVVPSS